MKQKPKKHTKKFDFRLRFKPSIRLFLIERKLVCDSDYSPDIVAICKSVSGARFNPDQKTWSYPIASFLELTKKCEAKDFQCLPYFKQDDLDLLANARDAEIQEAKASLLKNPFRVPHEPLVLASPQVVISRSASSPSLAIGAVHKSLAGRLIAGFPGAHVKSKDGYFWFPTEQLSELVKQFRNNQISFGVTEEAGKALAETAELRSSIMNDQFAPNRFELEKALLSPHLDFDPEDEDNPFICNWFTREQLQQAFPELKGGKRFRASRSEMKRFTILKSSLPFKVWLTKSAAKEILSGKSSSSEIHLYIGQDDQVWLVSGGVNDSEYSRFLLRQGDTWIVRDSNLEKVIEILEAGQLAYDLAPAVKERLGELQAGEKLREKTRLLAGQNDAKLMNLPSEISSRLYPHQRVGIQFLEERTECFLGDDMGLGKTLTVLSAFASLMNSQKIERLLVFCPASLLGNWEREAKRWFPEFSAIILSGSKAEKAWTLRLLSKSVIDTEIILVNYEAGRLDYIQESLEEFCQNNDVFICLDESQRVKNPQGKTFKALKSIVTKATRRVLLSGTPTPKNISDLWAQMYLLDSGKRLGKSYYRWLSKVAELGNRYSQYAIKRFRPEQVEDSLLRLDEILLRRKKEDVLSLPEKTFVERYIEMTGDQLERFEEIREALLLRTTTHSGKEFTREISTLLEEYLRAVQMASNPRLVDPAWKGEPAKFLELDQLVDELVVNGGKKIVIWTNYLKNIDELVLRYKEHGTAAFSGEIDPKTRSEIVHRFQNEAEPKILVAIPAAGGVGITLTAADTAIYIDKTWNGEHWMQSIDRVHRIGQKGTVTIISLLSSKVDWLIHRNVEKKRHFQSDVFDKERSELDLDNAPSLDELLKSVNSVQDYQEMTRMEEPERHYELDEPGYI